MIEVKPCSDADLRRTAEAFKMLSDETRLRILFYLKRGERNVTAICNALKASQPSISHHLGLLRSARLVEQRRSGKQIFYRLCEGLDPGEMMVRVLECRNNQIV